MRKTDKTSSGASQDTATAGSRVVRLREEHPPQFDAKKLKRANQQHDDNGETRFSLKEMMNRAFTGSVSFRAQEMEAPVRFTGRRDFEVDEAVARQFKALQQVVVRMNKAKFMDDIHIELPDAAEDRYDVTLHFEINGFDIVVPVEFQAKALGKDMKEDVYIVLPYKQFDNQFFDLTQSGYSKMVGDNILCTSNEFAEGVMAVVGSDYFDAQYAVKLRQKLEAPDNTP